MPDSPSIGYKPIRHRRPGDSRAVRNRFRSSILGLLCLALLAATTYTFSFSLYGRSSAPTSQNPNKHGSDPLNSLRSQTPYSTFSCMGDVENGIDAVYAKPFRFHVYQDMPKHLVQDILDLAEPWWSSGSATNQFITEALVWKYLSLHPCHTNNKEEADAFVVPAQTVAANWLSRNWNSAYKGLQDEGHAYMTEVLNWLKASPTGARFNLLDHYAVSIPWLKGIRTWPDENINLIGVEVPTREYNLYAMNKADFHAGISDITLPYPDFEAQAYFTDEKLKATRRNATIVFVGSIVPDAPVRKVAKDQFEAYNAKIGQEQAIWSDLTTHRADAHVVKDLVSLATFGAVFPGDSYSSRRIYSLIFANTIPVIMCDRCILPFQEFIDYREFCIFLSEERLMRDPTYNILEILANIPQTRIRELQAHGLSARRHFAHHEGPPQPGDAFDMLVRSMALRHYASRGFKDMMLRANGVRGW